MIDKKPFKTLDALMKFVNEDKKVKVVSILKIGTTYTLVFGTRSSQPFDMKM